MIPFDVPLHVYGTGWLALASRRKESIATNEVNGSGIAFADSHRGAKDDNPLIPKDFDCSSIPRLGIDKQENLRAGGRS